mmetsp:Transcript_43035/g.124465  ORF Transcript_43035/g.124465 Transcript_43035/m.124465 type:complete len:157 (-) Transcript_43035:2742-3212(-)
MDSTTPVLSGSMQTHAIRIGSGEDLVSSILHAAKSAMEKTNAQSAMMITAVGSLESATLRMANAGRPSSTETCSNEIKEWNERLEILSIVGTFSADGGKHLHMAVSDKNGNVFGGHVIDGKIFTTLELVIGTIDTVAFTREIDEKTGFDELVVKHT